MIQLLKRLTSKEIKMCLLSVAFICFGVFLDLKIPEYMSEITSLLQKSDATASEIMLPGSKMIYFSLLSFVASAVVGFLSARVAASFTTRTRREIYETVNRYSQAEIKRFSISSLLTRTTNDLTQIQLTITMGLQVIIKGPIMAVWAASKIAGKSGQWLIATVVAVLVVVVVLTVLLTLAFPKQTIIQKMTDKLNSITRESLTGVRIIRAYNAEDYQDAKFSKVNTEVTRLNLFINRIMALLNPMITLVASGLTLSIYVIGAYLIQKVTLPIDVASLPAAFNERIAIFSDMVVFTSYAMQVIFGFLMMSMIFIILPRAIVSAQRINEVLILEPSICERENPKSASLIGEIEFEDVSFRYTKNSAAVIEHVSFKVNKGETVAFIGSTGSGKSTLINLIPRFYDATEGNIFVDGINVKDYILEDLHNKISFVPQKAVLFSGTIRSNIAFGTSNASPLTDEQIWEALRLAQAEDFVREKPLGLDEPVAQGGTNFSGGQRQRLAIARVLARKPEIIIFDDSFSALDYQTDKKLRHDLNEKTHDITKLIVAQRIATIMDADKILVLDKGKVVGVGTHKELLKNNEVYREIAYSQFSKEEIDNA